MIFDLLTQRWGNVDIYINTPLSDQIKIKSKCICTALFTRKHVTEASHTPIELPLNQPKPSRKTRKNSQKNSMQEKKFKKPWEEQFSEGSPPQETVGERDPFPKPWAFYVKWRCVLVQATSGVFATNSHMTCNVNLCWGSHWLYCIHPIFAKN